MMPGVGLFPIDHHMSLPVYSAPLQGFTDAVWRRLHVSVAGGVDTYYTPFLRVERGEPRRRDIRDITGSVAVPQILFRDITEFRILTDAVRSAGHQRVDLNMGCPFPPQTRHGRGAALIANPILLAEVAREMEERYADMTFSVKMRLGMKEPDEWKGVIGILNRMPLAGIVIHPRVASQQYGGVLHDSQVEKFLEEAAHPVIFNGDILTPADCADVMSRHPGVAGVMIGRGLLQRPSLAAEIAAGEEWSEQRRLDTLLRLNAEILDEYRDTLCGDAQVLMKIKPYWEYAEPVIGHRAAKAIRKAGSMNTFLAAVAAIG